MPAPKHIAKLMTEILAETPDRPLSLTSDVSDEKLKAAGFDMSQLNSLRWSDTGVVTFSVDTKYHVVMWMANSAEDRAYQHQDFDDFFTGGYRDAKVNKGVVGMDWAKYKMLAKWHAGKFQERTTDQLLMGRLWRDARFVSFWNTKTDMLKEWRVIDDFITNMKLNPKKCAYEFIDKPDVELYDEVMSKETASTKVDPKVLRQMHTSPEIKKAVLGTDGGKKRSAQDQYARVGDGIIKLGSLLKEDPDTLYVAPGLETITKMRQLGIDKDNRIVKGMVWHDMADAVCFAYDKQHDVMLFSKRDDDRDRPVHDDLFSMMSIFAEHPNLFSLKRAPHGWTITPLDVLEWDNLAGPELTPCPLTFGGLNSSTAVKRYIENDAQVLGAPSRENPRYVFGRLWIKVPVVSYWAGMAQALNPKAFAAVEDMIKALRVDPTKTMYEFLDQEDRLFFYDELNRPSVSTMSRDDYLAKMAKQHLDPQAKRDLNKGIEKPDKFGGVLPAKYHAAQQTSDGIIKLGDLLP